MFSVWSKGQCTLVWNFRAVNNKYNLTLCQSRLHAASETFVHHKKNWIRFDFLRFHIRSKHFGEKIMTNMKKMKKRIKFQGPSRLVQLQLVFITKTRKQTIALIVIHFS